MTEAIKKVVINSASIVLAVVILWVIVYLYSKMKKPCSCNGGGVPSLKPDNGGLIQEQPAPVQDTGYSDGGFDYAN